jgi:RimJ/RimL family protein N-acetyltransferase
MIELKPFTEEDIPQLLGWVDSPEFLLQWGGLSFKYPLNGQKLEDYIKNANDDDTTILAFKVVHHPSNKTIGHISLGNIDRENGTARMCRVLIGDPSFKGQRLGRPMVQEVLNVAFNILKLHKVSLAVFDFNTAAIKLYEGIGFKTEGFIREACKIGDEYWSYYEMSILDREWKESLKTSK